MHDLPSDLREGLKGYKDPYGRNGGAEILKDWAPIFDVLRELHEAHPEWRFGQLVTNLAVWAGENEAGDTYTVPDERLLESARRHLRKCAVSEGALPPARMPNDPSEHPREGAG